eukprot:2188299-Amphidinium_carterae.3
MRVPSPIPQQQPAGWHLLQGKTSQPLFQILKLLSHNAEALIVTPRQSCAAGARVNQSKPPSSLGAMSGLAVNCSEPRSAPRRTKKNKTEQAKGHDPPTPPQKIERGWLKMGILAYEVKTIGRWSLRD